MVSTLVRRKTNGRWAIGISVLVEEGRDRSKIIVLESPVLID